MDDSWLPLERNWCILPPAICEGYVFTRVSVNRGGWRAWQGSVRGGMHGGGACVAGGQAWQGGMCGRGMHAPPNGYYEIGQLAGGTHPTGMPSCFFKIYYLVMINRLIF